MLSLLADWAGVAGWFILLGLAKLLFSIKAQPMTADQLAKRTLDPGRVRVDYLMACGYTRAAAWRKVRAMTPDQP